MTPNRMSVCQEDPELLLEVEIISLNSTRGAVLFIGGSPFWWIAGLKCEKFILSDL